MLRPPTAVAITELMELVTEVPAPPHDTAAGSRSHDIAAVSRLRLRLRMIAQNPIYPHTRARNEHRLSATIRNRNLSQPHTCATLHGPARHLLVESRAEPFGELHPQRSRPH